MEKRVISNRKRKGRTISLYFNKDDIVLFDFVESYSKTHKIAKGKLVIDMLKSYALMCAFSDYWTRTTEKRKELIKLFSQS